MTERQKHHNATDRQLRLLVGLVVFVASIAIVASVYAIAAGLVQTPSLLAILALTLAATASNRTNITIRLGANKWGQGWKEIVFLVGLVVVPPPWMVLCTAVGIVIGRLIGRVGPMKVAFGAGKDTIAVAAGGLVAYATGTAFSGTGPQFDPIAQLLILITVTVVDEVLVNSVVALATHTPLTKQITRELDIRLGFMAVRGIVALLLVWLFSVNRDAQLLLIAPLLILTLHLWYLSRIRSPTNAGRGSGSPVPRMRSTSSTWTWSAVAVARAPELFSADGAEIELRTPSRPARPRRRRQVHLDGDRRRPPTRS